jgi:hypothetical protein
VGELIVLMLLKQSKFLKLTALLTAMVFAVDMRICPQTALAEETATQVTASNLPSDLNLIRMPSEMGTVQETYKGTGEKTVVLIQDAHAVPDAQRSIQKLIQYFGQEYGINLVALEGASEQLDPTIFRTFPDKERLAKVFEEYWQNGELTGVNAAALALDAQGPSRTATKEVAVGNGDFAKEQELSSKPVPARTVPRGTVPKGTGTEGTESFSTFYGIEDWALYEEGLMLYRQAMAEEEGILAQLKIKNEELKIEKEKTYSQELLELDRKLEGFYAGKADLLTVLHDLSGIEAPEKGSELALFLESDQAAASESPTSQGQALRRIAEQVRRQLEESPNRVKNGKSDLAAFNEKYQDYQTSRISPEAFALELRNYALQYDIPFPMSAALSQGMNRQRRMEDIKGTELFKSFDAYVRQVKDRLIQNEDQRELDRQSEELRLLERFARLEISHEDWGRVSRGLWMVNSGKGNRSRFESHHAFYRNALQRDSVFLKNLNKLLSLSRTTNHYSLSTVIAVAGGFHTEGLVRQFREQGISYVLVTPRIDSIPEQTNYRKQMQGDVSWKNYFEVENGRINLYKAFVRATRDKLLGRTETRGLNAESYSSLIPHYSSLKHWRDQILRDLFRQGRITESGNYTRFLDEITNPDSRPTIHELRRQWLSNIDRFLKKFQWLDRKGQLTADNVAHLLRATTSSTVPITAAPLQMNASVAESIVRTEMRPSDPLQVSRLFRRKTLPPFLMPGVKVLRLDIDFEQTITPPYKAQKNKQINGVIAERLEKTGDVSESERFLEKCRRARVAYEAVPVPQRTDEDMARFYRDAFADDLTDEDLRTLSDSWELNPNLLKTFRLIRDLTGVRKFQLRLVVRGFTQPFEMFFKRKEIADKLSRLGVMTADIQVIGNRLVMQNGVFTGEVLPPIVSNKLSVLKKLKSKRIYVGDDDDAQYGLNLFINVNSLSLEKDVRFALAKCLVRDLRLKRAKALQFAAAVDAGLKIGSPRETRGEMREKTGKVRESADRLKYRGAEFVTAGETKDGPSVVLMFVNRDKHKQQYRINGRGDLVFLAGERAPVEILPKDETSARPVLASIEKMAALSAARRFFRAVARPELSWGLRWFWLKWLMRNFRNHPGFALLGLLPQILSNVLLTMTFSKYRRNTNCEDLAAEYLGQRALLRKLYPEADFQDWQLRRRSVKKAGVWTWDIENKKYEWVPSKGIIKVGKSAESGYGIFIPDDDDIQDLRRLASQLRHDWPELYTDVCLTLDGRLRRLREDGVDPALRPESIMGSTWRFPLIQPETQEVLTYQADFSNLTLSRVIGAEYREITGADLALIQTNAESGHWPKEANLSMLIDKYRRLFSAGFKKQSEIPYVRASDSTVHIPLPGGITLVAHPDGTFHYRNSEFVGWPSVATFPEVRDQLPTLLRSLRREGQAHLTRENTALGLFQAAYEKAEALSKQGVQSRDFIPRWSPVQEQGRPVLEVASPDGPRIRLALNGEVWVGGQSYFQMDPDPVITLQELHRNAKEADSGYDADGRIGEFLDEAARAFDDLRQEGFSSFRDEKEYHEEFRQLEPIVRLQVRLAQAYLGIDHGLNRKAAAASAELLKMEGKREAAKQYYRRQKAIREAFGISADRLPQMRGNRLSFWIRADSGYSYVFSADGRITVLNGSAGIFAQRDTDILIGRLQRLSQRMAALQAERKPEEDPLYPEVLKTLASLEGFTDVWQSFLDSWNDPKIELDQSGSDVSFLKINYNGREMTLSKRDWTDRERVPLTKMLELIRTVIEKGKHPELQRLRQFYESYVLNLRVGEVFGCERREGKPFLAVEENGLWIEVSRETAIYFDRQGILLEGPANSYSNQHLQLLSVPSVGNQERYERAITELASEFPQIAAVWTLNRQARESAEKRYQLPFARIPFHHPGYQEPAGHPVLAAFDEKVRLYTFLSGGESHRYNDPRNTVGYDFIHPGSDAAARDFVTQLDQRIRAAGGEELREWEAFWLHRRYLDAFRVDYDFQLPKIVPYAQPVKVSFQIGKSLQGLLVPELGQILVLTNRNELPPEPEQLAMIEEAFESPQGPKSADPEIDKQWSSLKSKRDDYKKKVPGLDPYFIPVKVAENAWSFRTRDGRTWRINVANASIHDPIYSSMVPDISAVTQMESSLSVCERYLSETLGESGVFTQLRQALQLTREALEAGYASWADLIRNVHRQDDAVVVQFSDNEIRPDGTFAIPQTWSGTIQKRTGDYRKLYEQHSTFTVFRQLPAPESNEGYWAKYVDCLERHQRANVLPGMSLHITPSTSVRPNAVVIVDDDGASVAVHPGGTVEINDKSWTKGIGTSERIRKAGSVRFYGGLERRFPRTMAFLTALLFVLMDWMPFVRRLVPYELHAWLLSIGLEDPDDFLDAAARTGFVKRLADRIRETARRIVRLEEYQEFAERLKDLDQRLKWLERLSAAGFHSRIHVPQVLTSAQVLAELQKHTAYWVRDEDHQLSPTERYLWIPRESSLNLLILNTRGQNVSLHIPQLGEDSWRGATVTWIETTPPERVHTAQQLKRRLKLDKLEAKETGCAELWTSIKESWKYVEPRVSRHLLPSHIYSGILRHSAATYSASVPWPPVRAELREQNPDAVIALHERLPNEITRPYRAEEANGGAAAPSQVLIPQTAVTEIVSFAQLSAIMKARSSKVAYRFHFKDGSIKEGKINFASPAVSLFSGKNDGLIFLEGKPYGFYLHDLQLEGELPEQFPKEELSSTVELILDSAALGSHIRAGLIRFGDDIDIASPKLGNFPIKFAWVDRMEDPQVLWGYFLTRDDPIHNTHYISFDLKNLGNANRFTIERSKLMERRESNALLQRGDPVHQYESIKANADIQYVRNDGVHVLYRGLDRYEFAKQDERVIWRHYSLYDPDRPWSTEFEELRGRLAENKVWQGIVDGGGGLIRDISELPIEGRWMNFLFNFQITAPSFFLHEATRRRERALAARDFLKGRLLAREPFHVDLIGVNPETRYQDRGVNGRRDLLANALDAELAALNVTSVRSNETSSPYVDILVSNRAPDRESPDRAYSYAFNEVQSRYRNAWGAGSGSRLLNNNLYDPAGTLILDRNLREAKHRQDAMSKSDRLRMREAWRRRVIPQAQNQALESLVPEPDAAVITWGYLRDYSALIEGLKKLKLSFINKLQNPKIGDEDPLIVYLFRDKTVFPWSLDASKKVQQNLLSSIVEAGYRVIDSDGTTHGDGGWRERYTVVILDPINPQELKEWQSMLNGTLQRNQTNQYWIDVPALVTGMTWLEVISSLSAYWHDGIDGPSHSKDRQIQQLLIKVLTWIDFKSGRSELQNYEELQQLARRLSENFLMMNDPNAKGDRLFYESFEKLTDISRQYAEAAFEAFNGIDDLLILLADRVRSEPLRTEMRTGKEGAARIVEQSKPTSSSEHALNALGRVIFWMLGYLVLQSVAYPLLESMGLGLFARAGLSPIVEEKIFRSEVFSRGLRPVMGRGHAIIVSALIFSAFHFRAYWLLGMMASFGVSWGLLHFLAKKNPVFREQQSVILTVLGVVFYMAIILSGGSSNMLFALWTLSGGLSLAVIYDITGKLRYPILVHMLANFSYFHPSLLESRPWICIGWSIAFGAFLAGYLKSSLSRSASFVSQPPKERSEMRRSISDMAWTESLQKIFETQGFRAEPENAGFAPVEDLTRLLREMTLRKKVAGKPLRILALGPAQLHIEKMMRRWWRPSEEYPLVAVEPALNDDRLKFAALQNLENIRLLTDPFESVGRTQIDVPQDVIYGIFSLEYPQREEALKRLNELAAEDAEFVFVLHYHESELARRVKTSIGDWKALVQCLDLTRKFLTTPDFDGDYRSQVGDLSKNLQAEFLGLIRKIQTLAVSAQENAALKPDLWRVVEPIWKNAAEKYVEKLSQYAPFVEDPDIFIPKGLAADFLSPEEEQRLRGRFNQVFKSKDDINAVLSGAGFHVRSVDLKEFEGRPYYYLAHFEKISRRSSFYKDTGLDSSRRELRTKNRTRFRRDSGGKSEVRGEQRRAELLRHGEKYLDPLVWVKLKEKENSLPLQIMQELKVRLSLQSMTPHLDWLKEPINRRRLISIEDGFLLGPLFMVFQSVLGPLPDVRKFFLLQHGAANCTFIVVQGKEGDKTFLATAHLSGNLDDRPAAVQSIRDILAKGISNLDVLVMTLDEKTGLEELKNDPRIRFKKIPLHWNVTNQPMPPEMIGRSHLGSSEVVIQSDALIHADGVVVSTLLHERATSSYKPIQMTVFLWEDLFPMLPEAHKNGMPSRGDVTPLAGTAQSPAGSVSDTPEGSSRGDDPSQAHRSENRSEKSEPGTSGTGAGLILSFISGRFAFLRGGATRLIGWFPAYKGIHPDLAQMVYDQEMEAFGYQHQTLDPKLPWEGGANLSEAWVNALGPVENDRLMKSYWEELKIDASAVAKRPETRVEKMAELKEYLSHYAVDAKELNLMLAFFGEFLFGNPEARSFFDLLMQGKKKSKRLAPNRMIYLAELLQYAERHHFVLASGSIEPIEDRFPPDYLIRQPDRQTPYGHLPPEFIRFVLDRAIPSLYLDLAYALYLARRAKTHTLSQKDRNLLSKAVNAYRDELIKQADERFAVHKQQVLEPYRWRHALIQSLTEEPFNMIDLSGTEGLMQYARDTLGNFADHVRLGFSKDKDGYFVFVFSQLHELGTVDGQRLEIPHYIAGSQPVPIGFAYVKVQEGIPIINILQPLITVSQAHESDTKELSSRVDGMMKVLARSLWRHAETVLPGVAATNFAQMITLSAVVRNKYKIPTATALKYYYLLHQEMLDDGGYEVSLLKTPMMPASYFRHVNLAWTSVHKSAAAEVSFPESAHAGRAEIGNGTAFHRGASGASERLEMRTAEKVEEGIRAEMRPLPPGRRTLEITMPDPMPPLTLQIPAEAYDDLREFLSYDNKPDQAMASLQRILKARRRHIDPEDVCILFWALRNYALLVPQLSEEEMQYLHYRLAFLLIDFQHHHSFGLADDSDDHLWIQVFLILWLTRVRGEIDSSAIPMSDETKYNFLNILSRMYSQIWDDLRHSYHARGGVSPVTILEGYLFRTLGSFKAEAALQPYLKSFEILRKEAAQYTSDKARQKLLDDAMEMGDALTHREANASGDRQTEIAKQLGLLQQALIPQNPIETRAWDKPLGYLIQLARQRQSAVFEPFFDLYQMDAGHLPIDEKTGLPTAWRLYLQWMKAMIRIGYPYWVFGNSIYFLHGRVIQQYLQQDPDSHSFVTFWGEVEAYLNDQRDASSLAGDYLHIDTTGLSPAGRSFFVFWRNVKQILQKSDAEARIIPADVNDQERQRLQRWLAEHFEQKPVFVGKMTDAAGFHLTGDQSVVIIHRPGQPHYHHEDLLVNAALPHATRKAMLARPARNRTRTVAIPLTANSRLPKLFNEGGELAPLHDEWMDAYAVPAIGDGKRRFADAVLVTAVDDKGFGNSEGAVPPEVLTYDTPPRDHSAVPFAPRQELFAGAMSGVTGGFGTSGNGTAFHGGASQGAGFLMPVMTIAHQTTQERPVRIPGRISGLRQDARSFEAQISRTEIRGNWSAFHRNALAKDSSADGVQLRAEMRESDGLRPDQIRKMVDHVLEVGTDQMIRRRVATVQDYRSVIGEIDSLSPESDRQFLMKDELDMKAIRFMAEYSLSSGHHINLYRLRSGGEWLVAVDANMPNASSALIDLSISLRPSRSAPEPSSGDLMREFLEAGVSHWILGSESAVYWTAALSQIRANMPMDQDHIGNLMLQKALERDPGQLPEIVEYNQDMVEETTRSSLGIKIDPAVSLSGFEMEDFDRDERRFDQILQEGNFAERKLAVQSFLALAFRTENLPQTAVLLSSLCSDQSYEVQKSALKYLVGTIAEVKKVDEVLLDAIKKFANSDYQEVRSVAYALLVRQDGFDAKMTDKFLQEMRSEGLWKFMHFWHRGIFHLFNDIHLFGDPFALLGIDEHRFGEVLYGIVNKEFGETLRIMVVERIPTSPMMVWLLMIADRKTELLNVLRDIKTSAADFHVKRQLFLQSLAVLDQGAGIIGQYIDSLEERESLSVRSWDDIVKALCLTGYGRRPSKAKAALLNQLIRALPVRYWHWVYGRTEVDPFGEKTGFLLNAVDDEILSYWDRRDTGKSGRFRAMREQWEKAHRTPKFARQRYLEWLHQNNVAVPKRAISHELNPFDTLRDEIRSSVALVPPVPAAGIHEISEVDKAAWVDRAGDNVRTRRIRQTMVDHVQRVSFEEFNVELGKAVAQFNEKIGDTPYAVLWDPEPHHSKRWVYEHAKDRLSHLPVDGVYFDDRKTDDFMYYRRTREALLDLVRRGVRTFAIFDDATQSGAAMSGLIAAVAKMLPNEEISIIVVTPFVTQLALDAIEAIRPSETKPAKLPQGYFPEPAILNKTVSVIHTQKVPTAADIFAPEDVRYLEIHHDRLNAEDRADLDLTDAENQTYAFYDFHIPDTVRGSPVIKALIHDLDDLSPYNVPGSEYYVQEDQDYHERLAASAPTATLNDETGPAAGGRKEFRTGAPGTTDDVVNFQYRTMLKQDPGHSDYWIARKYTGFNRPPEEGTRALQQELAMMKEVRSLGILQDFPEPLSDEVSHFDAPEVDAPISMDKMAFEYRIHKKRRMYLNEAKTKQELMDAFDHNLEEWILLLENGYVHTSLTPLNHNSDQNRAWWWNTKPIGGIEHLSQKMDYANMTLGGLIDWEHLEKMDATHQHFNLWDTIGQGVAEWMLAVSYYGFNFGLTPSEVQQVIGAGTKRLQQRIRRSSAGDIEDSTLNKAMADYVHHFQQEYRQIDGIGYTTDVLRNLQSSIEQLIQICNVPGNILEAAQPRAQTVKISSPLTDLSRRVVATSTGDFILTSSRGTRTGLMKDNGRERILWKSEQYGDILDIVWTTPEDLYVVNEQSHLLQIESNDGSIRKDMDLPSGYQWEKIGGSASAGLFLIGSKDGQCYLVKYDPVQKVVWEKPIAAFSRDIAVGDDKVFVVDEEWLWAFDGSDGHELWHRKTLDEPSLVAVDSEGHIAVGTKMHATMKVELDYDDVFRVCGEQMTVMVLDPIGENVLWRATAPWQHPFSRSTQTIRLAFDHQGDLLLSTERQNNKDTRRLLKIAWRSEMRKVSGTAKDLLRTQPAQGKLLEVEVFEKRDVRIIASALAPDEIPRPRRGELRMAADKMIRVYRASGIGELRDALVGNVNVRIMQMAKRKLIASLHVSSRKNQDVVMGWNFAQMIKGIETATVLRYVLTADDRARMDAPEEEVQNLFEAIRDAIGFNHNILVRVECPDRLDFSSYLKSLRQTGIDCKKIKGGWIIHRQQFDHVDDAPAVTISSVAGEEQIKQIWSDRYGEGQQHTRLRYPPGDRIAARMFAAGLVVAADPLSQKAIAALQAEGDHQYRPRNPNALLAMDYALQFITDERTRSLTARAA